MSNYRDRDSRPPNDYRQNQDRHDYRQNQDKGDFHYRHGKQNDFKKFNHRNDFKKDKPSFPNQQQMQRSVQIQNPQQGMRQDYQNQLQTQQMPMSQGPPDRSYTPQNRNVQMSQQVARQSSQNVQNQQQNRTNQQRHQTLSRQMSQPVPHTPATHQQTQQNVQNTQKAAEPAPPPPPASVPPPQIPQQVEEKPHFNFTSSIPSSINIPTNAAEIAIITEYFGDEDVKDKERAELLESRRVLSETYIASLRDFSDNLEKALPIIGNIPTSTQLFRTTTLNRSDLMSKQTHSEFLRQDFRNKLCLMYPDETTTELWQDASSSSAQNAVDWRDC